MKWLPAEEGELRLLLEDQDDLWSIQAILEPGDHVTASTVRTADAPADQARQEKAPKVRMTLTVQAENVEFQPFTDHLRILGPITAGPQDVGKYHTLALAGDRDDVRIRKARLLRWQRALLDERVQAQAKDATLLLALDDDEAQFGQLGSYGLRFLGSIPSGGLGKRQGDNTKAKLDYYDRVIELTKSHVSDDGELILLGPGFWREEFQTRLKAALPKLVVRSEGISQGGRAGLQEALKRGTLDSILEESQVQKESQWVERWLAGVAQGRKTAVGLAEVQAQLDIGSVELALVSEGKIREQAIQSLLERCYDARVDAKIISQHHESGEQLLRMGGIGAILRFDAT